MGSVLTGDSVKKATAVGIEVTPSPPQAKRRRRCVQSKLPWGSSPTPDGDNGVEATPEVAELEESEEDVSEEEYRRKKRRRKGKSTPRAAKKSTVTSKEFQLSNTGKKISLVSVRKFEGNNNYQKTNNNQSSHNAPENVPSITGFDLRGSYYEHQQMKCNFGNLEDPDGQSMYNKQPVSHLRLEAKLAAEENTRLSTDKHVHPFFSSIKAAKRIQDIQKEENRHWSDPDCAPFHVLDKKVDYISLDWSNWDLRDKSLLDYNGLCWSESTSSVFDGLVTLVEPLRVDTAHLKEMHLDQSPNTTNEKSAALATTSPILSDKSERKELLSDMEYGFIINQGSNREDTLVEERLLAYYQRSSYGPECSLWTDKYQPGNAAEVCGNHDSVQHLAEWLKSWHERFSKTSRVPKYAEHCIIDDSENSSYENEYNMDEANMSNLKNVLLITGPVGSGKSAAVYACAKEQGFEVIEMNTSHWRNSVCLRQKFGESLDSLGLKRWSVGKLLGPGIGQNVELLPSTTNIEECNRSKNLDDCKQDEVSKGSFSDVAEKVSLKNQVADRSLILFEDIDIIYDADHGFLSAISRLAEVSKRPIILTSNRNNPSLPPCLDRLTIEFELPSIKDLLLHCRMVCLFEKAQVSAYQLEHLIRSCLGDMRKSLMLLQFWCQGNKKNIVRTKQCTYDPLSFDIDAAHMVMPRVFSWGFRCELSERVIEEINKTISLMEESSLDLQLIKMTDSSKFGKITNNSKRGKKAKLKKNNSSLDFSDFPATDNNLDDFCDASKSLLGFSQRHKRRPNVILSSQSDDGPSADELTLTEFTSARPEKDPSPDVSTVPISQSQEVSSLQDLPSYDNCHSGRYDPVHPLNFGMASASHICDTYNLQDVSCVPESSFIAGTEFSMEESFVSVAASSEKTMASLTEFIQSIHVLPGTEGNSLNGGTTDVNISFGNNISTIHDEFDNESVHGTEELGDKYNEVEESQGTRYQFMDACSQADFNMSWVPGRCSKHSHVISVHDTWQRLRSQREDYKSYLTTNQKDLLLITRLASGLTDLMSETDMMFNTCHPLITDMLEPSSTPCVEPDDFSWYDEQLKIGSTYVQHGLCFYTSMCDNMGAYLGFTRSVALAQEMLASSTNIMGLGKLLNHGISMTELICDEGTDVRNPSYDSFMERKLKPGLLNALLPVVPPRLSMTLRGPGFNDYLSFMSHISKVECSRLARNLTEKSRRRSRASRHYLSSGSLTLSHEDVELLAQTSCFKSAAPY